MPDLYLDFGGDLQFGASGDLVTQDGANLTNQRLARRFFTNAQVNDTAGKVSIPGDYMFHTGYGAGLRAIVGGVMNSQAVDAVRQRIQRSAQLEPGVAPTPAPLASARFNAGAGELDVYLKFTTQAGIATGVGFTLTP